MNKIYLFLLALFASVGVAMAYPTNVKFQGDCYKDGSSSSGWNTIDLTEHNADNSIWVGSVEMPSGTPQFRLQWYEGTEWKAEYGKDATVASVPTTAYKLDKTNTPLKITLSQKTTIYFRATFAEDMNSCNVEFSTTTPFSVNGGTQGGDTPVLHVTDNKTYEFAKHKGKWMVYAPITSTTDNQRNFYITVGETTYTAPSGNSTVGTGDHTTSSTAKNNWWMQTPGSYTFTLSDDFSSITIESGNTIPTDDDDDDAKIPEELYLLGDCDYGYQSNTHTAKMEKSDDGKSFTILADFSGTGDCYFRFTTANDDKSANAAYGLNDADKNSAPADKPNLVAGQTNNWKLPKGKSYTLTVTFDDKGNGVLTAIEQQGTITDPEPAEIPTQMSLQYSVGPGNWTEVLDTTLENGLYSWTVEAGAETPIYYRFAKVTGKINLGKNDAEVFAPADNLKKGSGSTTVSANAGSQAWNAINDDKGTYTITAKYNSADEITFSISFEAEKIEVPVVTDIDYNKADKYYYLCGDINIWADVVKRNFNVWHESGKNQGEFTGSTEGYNYKQDDADNPYLIFPTVQELNTYWRFDATNEHPNYTNAPTSGWQKLDLSAKGSADRKNFDGRLCGQFKIIRGNLEDGNADNFGVGGGDNAEYFQNVVKKGQVFTASKNAHTNVQLSSTMVENAVIWFHPSDGKIFIEGNYKDLYVYYANGNGNVPADFKGPNSTLAKATSQIANYPATTPFVNSTKYSDDLDYSWHEYTGSADDAYFDKANGSGVLYNGTTHFDKVWRKKIPSSLIHRAPMGFLTTVERIDQSEAKYFGAQRIACEDLWFVENDIYMYFRFENEALMNTEGLEVFNNAMLPYYDANGVMQDDPYVMYPKMSEGETERVTVDGVDWFKSKRVDSKFANGGIGMFATNLGGFYPMGMLKASNDVKEELALRGTDLYYVVGGSDDRCGLVYSHLKGTTSVGAKVQINAEFFIDDESAYNHLELHTNLGAATYNFKVYNADGDLVAGTGDEYSSNPWYDWTTAGLTHGLYTVVLKVRENGKTYTATDIYPLYGSEHVAE